MTAKRKKKLTLLKNRERPSRMSLTVVLAIFVFVILSLAIGFTALGIYGFTKLGVLVNVEGNLDLQSVLLFMSLSSLIIGGLMAFFGSRIPLKPINELINKMNRLAAGDFRARLKFGNTVLAYSAFREISTSFNTMAEELENTEMLRSDFINNFSHEFKTPIVSIAGFARLLAREDLTEEQRTAYLRAIEEESMRLSAMATNVLSLTKIQNQTILTDGGIGTSMTIFSSKSSSVKVQFSFNLFLNTSTFSSSKDKPAASLCPPYFKYNSLHLLISSYIE